MKWIVAHHMEGSQELAGEELHELSRLHLASYIWVGELGRQKNASFLGLNQDIFLIQS